MKSMRRAYSVAAYLPLHWVSSFIKAWYIFHSYHAITLCPCTGMLMVFTVSSFLFFSVLLFLWLAETGKYEKKKKIV